MSINKRTLYVSSPKLKYLRKLRSLLALATIVNLSKYAEGGSVDSPSFFNASIQLPTQEKQVLGKL